ncbi:MAG: hypothetical protein AAGF66_11905 [Cyanobacteria bacterium P01_H01_bin.119]
MSLNPGQQLEQYSLRYPQEVLRVTAEIDGETDEILIFRGFSSSLVRSTAADPDVAVLPATAKIISIDRLQGPYNPDTPQYLEQALTWSDFQTRL